MQRCANTKNVYIVAVNASLKKAVIYQPRCGSWDCPVCARKNTDHWATRGAYGAATFMSTGRAVDFVTVTSRGYVTPAASVTIFKQAWPKLLKRATYKAGEKVEYMLIPERQKNGKLHAHFLITFHASNHFWHEKAFKSGLGYMAKAQEVFSPAGAAAYVSKYVTKQLEADTWPRGFRRVRVSNGWPALPDLAEMTGWEYSVFFDRGQMMWEYYRLEDDHFDVREL
jgi:hypothetical protein